MGVQMNSFAVSDYIVFFGTLVLSSGIGVFFAMKGRKKKSEGEYLVASRSMSVIPVSVSITVSFLSAISILGNPAEMYHQGGAFMLTSIGLAGGALVAAFVIVPVIYPLQLTSCFEYLERRFNSRAVRLLGTCLSLLSQVIYMGTASFAPATALYAVTGFPIWATLVIMAAVSTFYTSIGGMKAVVWTDVFQSAVMLIGLFAIIIQGTIKVGSFSKVWDIFRDWDRLDFPNFDPDPTVRHAFWPVAVGALFNWMGTFGLSQAAVQRYSSLPSLRKAQTATALVVFGSNLIVLSCCVSGAVIFAYYVTKECDPIGKKLVSSSNELVPFFVMETLAYPTVPGFFISALFSGALSSISSSLNAAAANTWEDLLKPIVSKTWSATKKVYFIQALVVTYGCLSLCVAFIVRNLEGTILQVTISLIGAVSGPTTGMFMLGIFFPWATGKGTFIGAIISMGISFWLVVGAYLNGIPFESFRYPNGTCYEYFTHDMINTTTTTTTTTLAPTTTTIIGETTSSDDGPGVERFYELSYLWYSAFGMCVTIIAGLIASFITGANSIDDVPAEYLSSCVRKLCCCFSNSNQKGFELNEESKKNGTTSTVSPIALQMKNGNANNGKIDYDNPAFRPDHDSNNDNQRL